MPDGAGDGRAVLAEAYRRLGRDGLIAGSSGNVSLRAPGGMLISPTGTTAERIAPADVVACGLDRPAPRASSEWGLHAALYRERPEFGAVVHTHAEASTALSCLRRGLPVFHYDVLLFGGAVRCAPYATFGTPELAALAAEAMRGRGACLLGGHGMIVAAATAGAAVEGALLLERLCRRFLLASAAGTPVLLTEAEEAAALKRFETYQKAG